MPSFRDSASFGKGMCMIVQFGEIESVYRQKIQEVLDDKSLNAEMMVERSSILFQTVKIDSLLDVERSKDMLLYQYGIYNWGEEQGEHFSLDITRQFIVPTEDEPYQLRFTLVYAPEPFRGIRSYNCWSTDFSDFDGFIKNIVATEGFKLAESLTPKNHRIQFEQC